MVLFGNTRKIMKQINKKTTVREVLQQVGTEFRNQLHPNIWVNSLMSEYKPINQSAPGRFTVNYPPEVDFIHNQDYDGDIERYLIYPNWVITDVRFVNEADAIKNKGGINIRIDRPNLLNNQNNINLEHISETSLDDYKFNYYVYYFFNLRSKSSKENYLCCLHVSFYGSSGNNCSSYDWIY